jgi:hypothetical protein
MKRILMASALLLAPGWASGQQTTQNVLFVGNSLTYFYGMPTTFSQMANAAGDKVAVTQHTIGNTGFVDHYVNPQLYATIRSKTWDYVILQPGSYESYGQPSVSTVYGYFSKMRDSILHYSPCAQIYLYEISNGLNGTTPERINEYRNIQATFLRNLQSLADRGKVPLVPAGEVSRNLFLTHNLMLWEGIGDIHPNPYGAYAIACAMYSTIFKKPVSGMPLEPLRWASDLDPQTAALIQRVSDSVVLKTPPDTWRHGTHTPYALFYIQSVDGNTMRFQNYSLNYDRLEWVFADGTTTDTENPERTLFTAGDKERVTLRAYKDGCYNSFSRTIDKNTDAVGINETAGEIQSLSIYPNPARDYIFIESSGTREIGLSTITLYNLSGQKVREQQLTRPGRAFRTTLPLAELPAGAYLIQINSDGETATHRIMLQ